MEKLSPKRKLEILVTYYDEGLSVRDTERVARCSHHTLPGVKTWFHKLTKKEIYDLASYYGLPSAPLVALYHQLAPKPRGDVHRDHQGHAKILDVKVGYWKGEDTNVVRRFVTLQAEAVGGDVVLEPPSLSFPGEQHRDVILHYAERAPYSQINQPSVLVRQGELIRVDIACTEPLVDPMLTRSALTSGEVHCALYYQPSNRAYGTGCFVAHPIALVYPVLDDKDKTAPLTEPFHLQPGNHPAKVRLPYNGGGVSVYLWISSPAEAHGLDAELLRIEQ